VREADRRRLRIEPDAGACLTEFGEFRFARAWRRDVDEILEMTPDIAAGLGRIDK